MSAVINEANKKTNPHQTEQQKKNALSAKKSRQNKLKEMYDLQCQVELYNRFFETSPPLPAQNALKKPAAQEGSVLTHSVFNRPQIMPSISPVNPNDAAVALQKEKLLQLPKH